LKLRGVAVRAPRLVGQDGGRPARRRSASPGPAHARRDPIPRARDARRSVRRPRAPVRRVLRTRLGVGTHGPDRRCGASSPVPDRRIGRGGMVIHPPGRRDRGDRARGRARRAGCLQRHGRRAGGGARLASRVRRRDRRADPASCPDVAWSPLRGRARRHDDDRAAWGLEREGQARAGVGAQVSLVASRVPRRPRLIDAVRPLGPRLSPSDARPRRELGSRPRRLVFGPTTSSSCIAEGGRNHLLHPGLRAWDEPRRWRLRVRPRLHNPVPLRRHQDTAQPFDVLGVRQIGGRYPRLPCLIGP
jgi:hypothetical protein